MFKINLSPVRDDAVLEVRADGDVLTVNGVPFDFTPMTNGDILPANAIGSDTFVRDVAKVSGVIEVTLRFPHGANPQPHVAFPEAIMLESGVAQLPHNEVLADD